MARPAVALGLCGVLWAGAVCVLAPWLAHKDFERYRLGGPGVGEALAAAQYWNPWHPDYRAALAEAVLRGREAGPADLGQGLLAAEEAIALNPIEPRFRILRARLARRAFAAGPGHADWIRIADAEYRAAERLDPHRPMTRLEHGWMLLDLGRFEAAAGLAHEALAGEPYAFEGYRLKAASALEMGRPDRARAAWEEATRRREEVRAFVPANAYEARVLFWDGREWAELERKLEPSAAAEPTDREAGEKERPSTGSEDRAASIPNGDRPAMRGRPGTGARPRRSREGCPAGGSAAGSTWEAVL